MIAIVYQRWFVQQSPAYVIVLNIFLILSAIVQIPNITIQLYSNAVSQFILMNPLHLSFL